MPIASQAEAISPIISRACVIELRVALAAAGDQQPAGLAIDDDEVDGDLAALLEVETGLESGQDRQHPRLALAALDIVAARVATAIASRALSSSSYMIRTSWCGVAPSIRLEISTL